MKKITRDLLLLVILFLPHPGWASGITDESLDRLIALSGINEQLADISGIVVASFENAMQQQESPFSERDNEIVGNAIIESFNASAMGAVVRREIKENITEEQARELFSWYESDIGKRITLAEKEAASSEDYRKMMEEVETLLGDRARVDIAKKFDSIVKGTEFGVRIHNYSALAVFTAFSQAENPDKPVNTEEFKKVLSSQEDQVREDNERTMLVTFIYTYKNVDMADLEKYLAFSEGKTVRHYYATIVSAFENSFKQSIDKMSKSLVSALDK